MNPLCSWSIVSCVSVTSWTRVFFCHQTAPSLSYRWKCCSVPLFALHWDVSSLFTMSCKANWMKKNVVKQHLLLATCHLMHVCSNMWDLPQAAGFRDKLGCSHKCETILWKSRKLTISIGYIFFTIWYVTSTNRNLWALEKGENGNSALDTTLRSRLDERISILSSYELQCLKEFLCLKFPEIMHSDLSC